VRRACLLSAGMSSRFDTDTAVVRVADGMYEARIDAGWWIERGPNGGYVAAVVMQAFSAEVADPHRHARSLTIHYLAPAVEGPAQISVRSERTGRLVRYLTARLSQGDRLLATAQAAFAILDGSGPSFADPSFPNYPQPGTIDDAGDPPRLVPLRQRYEYRHVTGAPWEGPARTAETGGWIRLAEPRPYDTALVAALTDAWYPAVFTRLTERFGVPTVDLTVHIRSIRALQQMRPDDWTAARFRTTVATEGFLEEDGQLWAPDGTLIAHSRQLGLLLAT
jgi:acyl-CoA thioesterase